MTDDVVRLKPVGPVRVITLNRPAVHNAVDDSVMEALEKVMDIVESDAGALALVLTGEGPRTFCAGGDLRYFATLEDSAAATRMSSRMQALLARLHDGPRPVVGAINGQALGGGCEIVTACHIRIASDTAEFCFRHARNGLTTGWGGGARLLAQLGRSKALDLLLTARTIGAEEALRMGLIDRTVPPSEVLDRSMELASSICSNAPPSVSGFLKLARHAATPADARMVEEENRQFATTWNSSEFQRVLERIRRPADPPD